MLGLVFNDVCLDYTLPKFCKMDLVAYDRMTSTARALWLSIP